MTKEKWLQIFSDEIEEFNLYVRDYYKQTKQCSIKPEDFIEYNISLRKALDNIEKATEVYFMENKNESK